MLEQMTAPAESSPAPVTTFEIPQGEARAEFMKTGEVPASKAASTPAKEPPAEGEKPEGKTAPASEPGKEHQEPKQKSAAALRLEELLDDMKREGITPNEIKEFRK